jgi:hypothetical protein
MEKVVRKFDSFAAADEADLQWYRQLTGDQRLELLLEIIMPSDPNEGVIERSARIYPLGREPRG